MVIQKVERNNVVGSPVKLAEAKLILEQVSAKSNERWAEEYSAKVWVSFRDSEIVVPPSAVKTITVRLAEGSQHSLTVGTIDGRRN